MPKYNYVAMDAHGKETKGTLEVASQNEAIGRVKEMGLFPTKIVEIDKAKDKGDKQAGPAAKAGAKKKGKGLNVNINIKIPGLGGRVKSKVLCTFTRPPRPGILMLRLTLSPLPFFLAPGLAAEPAFLSPLSLALSISTILVGNNPISLTRPMASFWLETSRTPFWTLPFWSMAS